MILMESFYKHGKFDIIIMIIDSDSIVTATLGNFIYKFIYYIIHR